mgnify:FL=1
MLNKSGVIYRGPSMIDGQPIVVIAIATSGNTKTGAMLQTFILVENTHPVEALKLGLDASVCGDCLARPANGGWCYVRVEQSVAGVWKCYHKLEFKITTGKNKGQISNYAGYPIATKTEQIIAMGAGREVRLGTYGDPAAVPLEVWDSLTTDALGWNGYTHQWKSCSPDYARFCMASIDQPCDTVLAEILGYRCFIAKLPGEPVPKTNNKSVGCPAARENGAKATCSTCMGCGGNDGVGTTNRVIEVHGVDFKTKRYQQWRLSA